MFVYETIYYIYFFKCCVRIIIDGLNIKYNLDSINIHVYIYIYIAYVANYREVN